MSSHENDVLQPIDDERILTFLEITKEKLPISLRAHHFLWAMYKRKVFLKNPENKDFGRNISARSNFNLFTHRNGDMNNCTFVAITVEGPKEHIDVSKFVLLI